MSSFTVKYCHCPYLDCHPRTPVTLVTWICHICQWKSQLEVWVWLEEGRRDDYINHKIKGPRHEGLKFRGLKYGIWELHIWRPVALWPEHNWTFVFSVNLRKRAQWNRVQSTHSYPCDARIVSKTGNFTPIRDDFVEKWGIIIDDLSSISASRLKITQCGHCRIVEESRRRHKRAWY